MILTLFITDWETLAFLIIRKLRLTSDWSVNPSDMKGLLLYPYKSGARAESRRARSVFLRFFKKRYLFFTLP